MKPRLLGHWGTTPGLNFLYAHFNRAIVARDLNAIFVTGPGHGGPALVANTYLEGTYSEVYPHIGRDEEGLRRLFRQFSFPGGVPSHVAPETPGSIHEGGELGYALVHAYGAAFDNPDLLVCCVVGDGEAETGPLAASWHSNKFVDPERDGVVLPILHLNGYKIANPTVLARIPDEELRDLMRGYGHEPYVVEGDEPEEAHQRMAATLDEVLDEIEAIRRRGDERPRWPMIVLRTPKGWTGPKEVDGLPTEGSFRSHQVPLAQLRTTPSTSRSSSAGCGATGRRSSSTTTGRCARSSQRSRRAASGGWERTRTRTAVRCCASSTSRLPRLRRRRAGAGANLERGDARPRRVPARRRSPKPGDVPALRPRRDRLEPTERGLRGDGPRVGRRAQADGRPSRAATAACSRS